MAIVFVEAKPEEYGATDQRLLAPVRDYEPGLWWVERKQYRRDDPNWAHSGAHQVEEVCAVLGLATDRFRVCGVNTDICVFFTMLGLNRLYPEARLELVERACNTPYCDSRPLAVRDFHMYAARYGLGSYVIELMEESETK